MQIYININRLAIFQLFDNDYDDWNNLPGTECGETIYPLLIIIKKLC